MDTFTPGPWYRNIKPASHYPTIYAGRNKHVASVARVYDASGRLDEGETEANLTLIQAAPAMFAALDRFAEAMKRGSYPELQGVASDTFAALALARGES